MPNEFIIRSSNVTKRNLVTSCFLVNSVRSDNNPQGFQYSKFSVVENKDIEVDSTLKIKDMKLLPDLDALVKTLTDKGYDGYFHTESCCPGKLKDSINVFFTDLGKWY